MPLIKCNSHPAPGYHADGSLVVVENKSVGSAQGQKKTAQANLNMGNSGFGGGGGGGAGGGGFGGGGAGGGFGGGGAGGFDSTFGSGQSGATIDRYNPIRDRLDEGSVVEDWIPRDASGLDQMFLLMYHRDHIAGTMVDILAEMIWSEFDLVGIKDPVIRNIYLDSMNAIDTVGTMPDITREFLVLGRSISSMIFDKTRGIFKDLVSHDPSFVRLTPIPIKGFDPKLDLIPSPAMRAFIDSEDPRDIDARKILPASYIEAIRAASGGGVGTGSGMGGGTSNWQGPSGGSGMYGGELGGPGIPLDPINTLFLPRKRFNYDYIGTSLFTRLITFWALEKTLINATMTSARRRSRSILHVKAGIDDRWEPTAQEMDNIAGMFIQADEDPVGAVVVTRTGVDTEEIRNGQDFYKWSDEWELLSQGKLQALGANDGLLSGDATYSNQENARMFFMERAINLRDSITTKLFYNRLFPLLARIHGFRKRTTAELSHNIRVENSQTGYNVRATETDGSGLTQRQALDIPESELITPEIIWKKELVSDIDETRLDVYERLEEKGVPIHLRDWSAAGNIDLDQQMSGLELDADLRKQVNTWKAASGMTETEGEEEEARLEFVQSLKKLAHSNIQASLGSETKELGPLSGWLFWGTSAMLGPLKAKELASFLKTIKPDDNSCRVLLDGNALKHKIGQHFQNEIKAEIAHYLMFRSGFTRWKPSLSEDTIDILATQVKQSLDQYANHGNVYQLGKVAEKELRLIAGLTAKAKEPAKQFINKSHKKLNKKAQASVSALKDGYGIDKLSPKSPKLFSGV